MNSFSSSASSPSPISSSFLTRGQSITGEGAAMHQLLSHFDNIHFSNSGPPFAGGGDRSQQQVIGAGSNLAPPLKGKDLMYSLMISQLVADNHHEIAANLAQTRQLMAFRSKPAQHLTTIVDSYCNAIRTAMEHPNVAQKKFDFSVNPEIITFYSQSGNIKQSIACRPGAMQIMQSPSFVAGPVVPKPEEIKLLKKFGSPGAGRAELDTPCGFCMGPNDDIVIADTNNHRISVFTLQGEYLYSFGEEGIVPGKLYQPRKIALLRPQPSAGPHAEVRFVVCDRGPKRSRMQIFSLTGRFIRQIDIPCVDIVSGLTTTFDGKIVIVDSVKSAVSVFTPDGSDRFGFICGSTMNEPSDIAVHRNEFYICDFKGNSVVVFNQRGSLVRTIRSEHTQFPNGIDISDNGDVMVGNSHGNRFHVTLFNEDGRYIADYECPTIKVSRCCGLKCSKDGFLVSLAKNNNHALVFSPLYC